MDRDENKCHSEPYKVRIAANGRLVIPAEVRQEAGIKEGDELLLTRDDKGIHIMTLRQAVKDMQSYFAQFKKPGVDMVDDFLRERREEAAQEEREFSNRTRSKQ